MRLAETLEKYDILPEVLSQRINVYLRLRVKAQTAICQKTGAFLQCIYFFLFIFSSTHPLIYIWTGSDSFFFGSPQVQIGSRTHVHSSQMSYGLFRPHKPISDLGSVSGTFPLYY